MKSRLRIFHPKFPFDTSRLPFFYGFIILFAGIVGILMSIPGQTMGVSVFTESLISEFQLTRDQLSMAYGIGTFISSFLLTKAGKFYDKYGVRPIVTIACTGLAVMLIYLTYIGQFTASLNHDSLLVQAFIIGIVAIGFWGIRFFGQGILTMTARNMVMKWFNTVRGRANLVLGSVVAFGFAASPKLLNALVDSYGWKGTWVRMAATVGIGFLLFALFFYRDNPEECVQKADGNIKLTTKKRPKSMPDKDWELNDANKTLAFWAFNLGLVMFSLYFTAITFHIEKIFSLEGFERDYAFSIFIPASLIALGLQLIGSPISDYTRLKYFLSFMVLGFIVSIAGMLLLGSHPGGYYLIIAGHGIGTGIFSIISTVTWPRFFGNTHLGAIAGFNMSWMVAGSAIGPYFFAVFERFTCSFDIPLIVCGVICIAIFVISFKAENPNADGV